MSIAPTLWLVELRDSYKPVGLYLHAFEDDRRRDAGSRWLADPIGALRFKSKAAADTFIFDHVHEDAVAAPFAPAELVAGPDHISEVEIERDLATS